MDRKDVLRMAQEPKYIHGIYNYCDRWCERCAFTSRCLTFALNKEDSDDQTTRDINNQAFWDKLHVIFEQTREMIIELAAERGIDLNSLDTESASKDFSRRLDESKQHKLSLAARHYSEMVERWLEAEYSSFEQRQDELNTKLRIGVGGDGQHVPHRTGERRL